MLTIVSSPAAAASGFPFATALFFLLIIAVRLAAAGALVYLFVLLVKALRKYLKGNEIRRENAELFRSLGEVLKAHRLRCHMTQEFVAERLNVSRQAVSKWENGTSDPSTSNLLALAKLYDTDAGELLRQIQQ